MIRLADGEPHELALIDVDFEVYLKERDNTMLIPATLQIRRDMLDAGKELDDLVNLCVLTVLKTIDVVGEHRLLFSNREYNKTLILTDQVQAISILPPSQESVMRALETGDSKQ